MKERNCMLRITIIVWLPAFVLVASFLASQHFLLHIFMAAKVSFSCLKFNHSSTLLNINKTIFNLPQKKFHYYANDGNYKKQLYQHEINVATNNDLKTVSIAAKQTGYGSSINGGEMLLLALATCFCNDIYREANKRNITISSVEFVCKGEFGAEGEPGENFSYTANVVADTTPEAIADLIQNVDKIAEVHNTLRKGLDVKLKN